MGGWSDWRRSRRPRSQDVPWRTNEAGEMLVSADSFDAEGNNLIQFPASINGCLVETERGPFSFTLPFSGVIISLNLAQTQIAGKVSVGDNGINMTETNIDGYFTREAITDLIGSHSVNYAQATTRQTSATMSVLSSWATQTSWLTSSLHSLVVLTPLWTKQVWLLIAAQVPNVTLSAFV